MPRMPKTRCLLTAEDLLDLIFRRADAARLPTAVLRLVARDQPDSGACNWWARAERTGDYRLPGDMKAIITDCAVRYNLAESEREWCNQ